MKTAHLGRRLGDWLGIVPEDDIPWEPPADVSELDALSREVRAEPRFASAPESVLAPPAPTPPPASFATPDPPAPSPVRSVAPSPEPAKTALSFREVVNQRRAGPRSSARARRKHRRVGEGVLNHYDVLGVEPTADLDTIRRAWRVKVRLLHPDKHQGSPPEVQDQAASETLRATVAWETLRDPDKRRAYDSTVHAGTNGNGNGTANGNGAANGNGNGNGHGHATGTYRRASSTQTAESGGDLRVTCMLCSTTQGIPLSAGRFVCTSCDEAWQLAKCEGCDKIGQVRERRTNWRCTSCNRQQNATWGGGARRVFCTRCKAGTDVEAGVSRFRCVGCGLDHLRCSCGHYRTFPALPWLSWRCPRCKRLNQIAERDSLAVGRFLVLVGAVILVLIGVVLFAGMLR